MKKKQKIPMKFYDGIDYIAFFFVIGYCILMAEIIGYDFKLWAIWFVGMITSLLLFIWVKDNEKRGLKKVKKT